MYGRFVDWILLIGSLIGLAATGWWAVYAAPNNAQSMQTELQMQAEEALREGGHDWVSVVMDGQHARLSGQSPSFESLEAVKASLGGGNLLMGAVTKITSDVASAPPISPYAFRAEQNLDDGRLILTGHVPDRIALDEILAKADEVALGEVDNQLQIGSGEPLGPWKDVVLAGIDRLKLLEGGVLQLRDSDVSLSGESATADTSAEAFEVISGANGAYKFNVDIRDPALWSARHRGGRLLLSGIVADEAQRAELIILAKSNYSGQVLDNMKIQAGQTADWIATAQSLLPGFAKFQSGTLSFEPETGGFTVQGKAVSSVEAYLREDVVTGDYPVVIEVEAVSASLPELNGLDFESNPKEACQAGFDAVMAANTILFETGKKTISRESGLTLDKIVAVAEKCADYVIEVRGHTDSSGDREANIILSKTRAGAVSAYMIEQGIAPSGLDVVGFGPDVPLTLNETAAGRAANRRIEFKIVEEG